MATQHSSYDPQPWVYECIERTLAPVADSLDVRDMTRVARLKRLGAPAHLIYWASLENAYNAFVKWREGQEETWDDWSSLSAFVGRFISETPKKKLAV